MGATLRQVAERAGVAISTASNVLNGKHRLFPISDETKDRVLTAAQELGFTPKRQARSRGRKRIGNIGCVFAAHLDLISDPFLSPVLSGIGTVLDEHRYELLLSSGYEDIADRLLTSKDRKVDGLLYLVYTATYEHFHADLARELASSDLPVMGMQFFERHRGGRAVGLRSRRSSALAVKHLHDLGHDAIGFIAAGPRRMLATQELCEGFTEAVADHGVARSRLHEAEEPGIAPVLGRVRDHYGFGRTFAAHLHASGDLLEAYVITSDLVAAGFRDGLAEHGLRVPHDIALVGMGNLLDGTTGHAFLTSIDDQRAEIGRTAARRLLALIDGEAAAEEFVALDPELIVRESCGAGIAPR